MDFNVVKTICILGSTGSIGKNALQVISKFPEKFNVIGLTTNKNISLLLEQISQFKPKYIAIADKKSYYEFKKIINKTKARDLKILHSEEGICEVARIKETDIVISAIVGSAGLMPTISAIKAGKTIGLANKETLVIGGLLVKREIKKYKAILLPIDSEHSAIFQCLQGRDINSVKRILLTASGGPFLCRTKKDLMDVTLQMALKHPNWKMGKKITIDSATLMNKGLEMIEAHYLFGIPIDKIDVLIHPQSIIHSIVEFQDEGYLSQMSRPDMKGPIAFALSYPERLSNVMKPIQWERLSGLTFQKPDKKTFPCLSLAYQAIKMGGIMPTVLNAANEIAVNAFLNGKIGFNDIPIIIKNTMKYYKIQSGKDLISIRDIDTIIKIDKSVRNYLKENLFI